MAEFLKDFKNAFNGGTRANRFAVFGNWPYTVTPKPPTNFHIFAASIPSFSTGTITVPHRGRNAYFSGDREVQPWVVSVYDDTGNWNLWRAMTQWSNSLNNFRANQVVNNQFSYPSQDLTAGNALLTNWTVKQLNDCDEVLKIIDFHAVWPVIVSEIPVDMGNGNPVTFQVTLSYDYATVRNV